jgi:hypothetical protein
MAKRKRSTEIEKNLGRGQRIMSCVRVSRVFGHEGGLRLEVWSINLIHVSSNDPTNILGWQGC